MMMHARHILMTLGFKPGEGANAELPFTNSEKALSDKTNPDGKACACNSYAAAAKAVHVAQSTNGRARVVKDLAPEALSGPLTWADGLENWTGCNSALNKMEAY